MKGRTGKLILGLESGLDGGVISILENGKQVGFATGEEKVSRSEELLSMLEELLVKNGLEKGDIGRIVVSDEPGSLTGIRIGLSLAMGLGSALGVEPERVSVLDALAEISGIEVGNRIAALATKGGGIFLRSYRPERGGQIIAGEILKTDEVSGVTDILEGFKNEMLSLVINEYLSKRLKEEASGVEVLKSIRIVVVSGNLGEILAKSAV